MQLLIATSNPHKLEEILAIIGNKSIELVSLADLPRAFDEPVEDGDTFEANAILKARYYANAAGMLCLADDSGLEVDALGGDPGVRSARYSNADAPRAERDAANCRLLLENLAGVPIEQRTARFVCAMALFGGREPNDEPVAVVRGTLEGRILMPDEADDPAHPECGRGHNGFGYDPIVFLPEKDRTVAELTSDEKNDISHRSQALVGLIAPIIDLWHKELMRTYHRERTVDLDVIKDFMSAAITDHAKARELLKDNPKLLDTNVTCGETPLHSHAISGHISALEFLAGEGFEVDSRNVFGDTPLMDAADMDELETAEVLLRLGADPNAESGNHDYALFRAIMYGNPKMVKLLLDHGASTNHTNCYGESVMDVAREIENNRSEIEQLLRQAMGQDSSD